MAKPNLTGPAKTKPEPQVSEGAVPPKAESAVVAPPVFRPTNPLDNPVPIVTSSVIKVISSKPTKLVFPVQVPPGYVGIFVPEATLGNCRVLAHASLVVFGDVNLSVYLTDLDIQAYCIQPLTEIGKLVWAPTSAIG
jgi:hypothetical protein